MVLTNPSSRFYSTSDAVLTPAEYPPLAPGHQHSSCSSNTRETPLRLAKLVNLIELVKLPKWVNLVSLVRLDKWVKPNQA